MTRKRSVHLTGKRSCAISQYRTRGRHDSALARAQAVEESTPEGHPIDLWTPLPIEAVACNHRHADRNRVGRRHNSGRPGRRPKRE
jgi:hypothetical protein